ncbi:MAG: ribonuclease HII [Candidatus Pacearchaeota archaeon]
MSELILGIDDAGRGPVIGPMVLAGCLIDKETEQEFKKIGVKDSKQLTPKRRAFLADVIREKAENFEVVVIYPDEIAESNASGTKLNEVEAIACAEIINRINSDQKADTVRINVVVDCPSPGIIKWKDFLKTKIDDLSNLNVACEHKADVNHISVSAASILAKDVREKEMTILKEKYGPEIGSGYASDPNTIRFLEKHALKYKDDGLFRKTWITWQNAVADLEQAKL